MDAGLRQPRGLRGLPGRCCPTGCAAARRRGWVGCGRPELCAVGMMLAPGFPGGVAAAGLSPPASLPRTFELIPWLCLFCRSPPAGTEGGCLASSLFPVQGSAPGQGSLASGASPVATLTGRALLTASPGVGSSVPCHTHSIRKVKTRLLSACACTSFFSMAFSKAFHTVLIRLMFSEVL